jgi:proteasome lid subunit RPN8/RPN11
MPALTLTPAQATALAGLAEAAFPREACALLVGIGSDDDGIEVRQVVPTANVTATPERGFEIDPAAHIALLRSLRDGNAAEWIVGHWHSHPNGRAEPSATDAAMIHDPALVWLISAVDAGGRAQPPRAFRPQPDGRFAPIELNLSSPQQD